jgi:phosphotransferase system  glucose/maltose/N-acetylglucosamine-specific IIC component
MVELAAWLASLPVGQALRRLNWLVPWLQIVHILANGLILSAVVMIDMRVWGISRSQASIAMARRFQSWIWAGLAVLTVSGIMLTMYGPRRVLTDVTFQIKMAAMGFAIVTTLALLLALRPGREAAKSDAGGDWLAAVLGTLTLALWIAVTLAGRGRWLTLLLMR